MCKHDGIFYVVFQRQESRRVKRTDKYQYIGLFSSFFFSVNQKIYFFYKILKRINNQKELKYLSTQDQNAKPPRVFARSFSTWSQSHRIIAF